MPVKFYSTDLPAARAYVANQLASCGYAAEAETVRKDTGFNLDVAGFVRRAITRTAAILAGPQAQANHVKAPAHQVSTDAAL